MFRICFLLSILFRIRTRLIISQQGFAICSLALMIKYFVQGSIFGPISYAIFVSPLLDLAKLTLFADDNYIVEWNAMLHLLINDMDRSLEMITKWLRQSGLRVNDLKTEVCLFHRNDCRLIHITVNGSQIQSKSNMNVLGISFDTKRQWVM